MHEDHGVFEDTLQQIKEIVIMLINNDNVELIIFLPIDLSDHLTGSLSTFRQNNRQ